VNLGLVVPRYGTEVFGGTEHWLRLLCEHLAEREGWQVDVFTTCAVSATTWADELAAGDSELNGVRVHRHRSVSGRRGAYVPLGRAIAPDPGMASAAVVEHYLELQGPVCPDVVEAAARSACDLVAVTPYLYWPAVHSVRRMGRRVLFHCAAHDELELHLPVMREVFEAVGGFAFNSFSERALVQRHFDVAAVPCDVIGNAVVEGAGDPELARRALGLGPGEPFVLCIGKVERSKGVHALAELWRLYRSRRPGAPRLVVVGSVHEPMISNNDVIVAGTQPEDVKWGALRQCMFVVSPSAWESFSLVVVEAMLAARPVVVNARCDATVEHCRRSGGGVWFDHYAEFEVVADRLLGDEGLRRLLGERGEAYARRQFDWDAVLARYVALAETVTTTWPRPMAGVATGGR